jgi:predicted dienelactone hydrolase
MARSQGNAAQGVEVKEPRSAIGYRVVRVPSVDARGEKHQLDVAVWYPTSGRPGGLAYDCGTRRIGAMVAEGGPLAEGQFPLIVYSHGVTGSGLSSVFLTQHLAGQGYIVAAPDHTDDYSAVRIDPGKRPRETAAFKLQLLRYMQEMRTVRLNAQADAYRPRMAYRPKQVKDTIDFLLHSPTFAKAIDGERLGMVGHSFGAWTTMLIAGADPQYADRRVKAAVALSGPVNPHVYKAAELAQISIPVMLVYGTTEVSQGRGDDRGLLYDRMTGSPVYLLGIEDADHFTFAVGGERGYATVAGYLERDPRRARIVRYAEEFFDWYLNQRQEAKQFLDRPAENFIHQERR